MHHGTFQFERLDLWSLGFLSCSLMNSGCDWCSESSQAPALLFCCFVSAEELGKPLCSFCLKIGLRTRNHDDALARNICCWFFVLENQSYFAHSLPCSPCVVLLDKPQRASSSPSTVPPGLQIQMVLDPSTWILVYIRNKNQKEMYVSHSVTVSDWRDGMVRGVPGHIDKLSYIGVPARRNLS